MSKNLPPIHRPGCAECSALGIPTLEEMKAECGPGEGYGFMDNTPETQAHMRYHVERGE